jgi:dipeptidase E
LAGLSAGSICWFEEGVTDSIPGGLTKLDCLGFLPGSNCPHYDGESDRRPSYQRLVQSGGIGNGMAADDGVGLHYKDDKIFRVVSSRPNAKAYKVDLINGKVIEEEIKPIFLGS